MRAAGAEPRIVKHSEGKLTAAKSTLDKAARPRGELSVRGWYVDPTTNSVVVNARPGATTTADEFVQASGADLASVRIVSTTEAPRLLDREPFGVNGGDQLAVPLGICSIGFTIIKVGFYPGWVTAVTARERVPPSFPASTSARPGPSAARRSPSTTWRFSATTTSTSRSGRSGCPTPTRIR